MENSATLGALGAIGVSQIVQSCSSGKTYTPIDMPTVLDEAPDGPPLKAGLIGAAVAVGLQLIGLIPYVGGCINCLGLLILAVVVGILAVRMSRDPFPTSGSAAGAGAIAGGITGAASSIVGGIIFLIQTTVGFRGAGGPDVFLRNLPPDVLREFQRQGIDPQMFAEIMNPRTMSVFAIVGGCVGLVFGIIIFGAIGAIAAMVYYSSQQDKEPTSVEE